MLSKQEIVSKLKQFDLKSTNQRVIIYDAIYGMKNHPCTENIYDCIKNENPSITLATVYKTLESFANCGLINKISTENGKVRFDPNTASHNHVHCLETNEIFDFYDKDLETLLNDFIKSKRIDNFEIKDFKLLVKGNKIDLNRNIKIH